MFLFVYASKLERNYTKTFPAKYLLFVLRKQKFKLIMLIHHSKICRAIYKGHADGKDMMQEITGGNHGSQWEVTHFLVATWKSFRGPLDLLLPWGKASGSHCYGMCLVLPVTNNRRHILSHTIPTLKYFNWGFMYCIKSSTDSGSSFLGYGPRKGSVKMS